MEGRCVVGFRLRVFHHEVVVLVGEIGNVETHVTPPSWLWSSLARHQGGHLVGDFVQLGLDLVQERVQSEPCMLT